MQIELAKEIRQLPVGKNVQWPGVLVCKSFPDGIMIIFFRICSDLNSDITSELEIAKSAANLVSDGKIVFYRNLGCALADFYGHYTLRDLHMRSGSHPSKLKLTFDDAVVAAPTPDEKKAPARVEEMKRNNKQNGPEEGKAGKQDDFVLRPTYDAIGRELFSLVAAALREIGKQDMETPTKADKTMLLPLAQKMGKIFGRCASKQV